MIKALRNSTHSCTVVCRLNKSSFLEFVLTWGWETPLVIWVICCFSPLHQVMMGAGLAPTASHLTS